MSNVDALKQEILRKHWHLNMESRIIGKTGLILNGQHTLIALVLAVQEWKRDKDAYPEWKSEPKISTVICYGADESDNVVNTMDTARPRTLMDVVYRTNYFPEVTTIAERKKVARILSFAIRLVWDRTGVADAYAISRTHSESIDFVSRHPKILECVQHILTENNEKKIQKQGITPGYASGLLYLMGCYTTNPLAYRESLNPSEDLLDWGAWDKACNFWVELAAGNLPAIRKVLSQVIDDDDSSLQTKIAVVIEAFTLYSEGLKVTPEDIYPEYDTDENDFRRLASFPTLGGIDRGIDKDEQITPEEVEQRKQEETKKEVAKKKTAKKKASKRSAVQTTEDKPPKKSAKKKKRHSLVGKTPWVAPEDAEPYQGKVTKVVDKTVHLEVLQGHQGAGSIRKVPIAALLAKQPDHRADHRAFPFDK
jgi:hypothetical protein